MKIELFEPEIQIAFLRREIDQLREAVEHIQLIKGDTGERGIRGEKGDTGDKGEPGETPTIDTEALYEMVKERLKHDEITSLVIEGLQKLSARLDALEGLSTR